MYLSVRETNPISAVYFMAMLLIGNFVLLNLFLAAVVETCSQVRKSGSSSRAPGAHDALNLCAQIVQSNPIQNSCRGTRRARSAETPRTGARGALVSPEGNPTLLRRARAGFRWWETVARRFVSSR